MTVDGEVPANLTSEIYHWELSGKVANQATALSILVCIAGFLLFFGYISSLDQRASFMNALLGTFIGLILSLPLFVLHELFHGLGYWWTKGKPKYGVVVVAGMPAFYATAPGHWMTRSQFTVVAALPIVCINIINLRSYAVEPKMRVISMSRLRRFTLQLRNS